MGRDFIHCHWQEAVKVPAEEALCGRERVREVWRDRMWRSVEDQSQRRREEMARCSWRGKRKLLVTGRKKGRVMRWPYTTLLRNPAIMILIFMWSRWSSSSSSPWSPWEVQLTDNFIIIRLTIELLKRNCSFTVRGLGKSLVEIRRYGKLELFDCHFHRSSIS